jgi:Protein of unknown function (DUF3828)
MPKTDITFNTPHWWALKEIASKFLQQLLLCICFAISIVSHANASESKTNALEAPDTVVSAFYTWYLKELSNNEDPVSDSASKIQKYVHSKTLKKIHKMINSPNGMESDYFLQTQDYMDEWLTPPESKVKKLARRDAEVIITLGAGTKASHKISATMLIEGGSWKISKVTKLKH